MSRASYLRLLAFAALAAFALWLRGPSFGHAVWNVDEAIHSAVARELLDGGVLYRDAIDQRTPLTYYVVAAVYAVAGPNNIYALHVFTALLIAATGFILWRAGAAWRQAGAGAWAAALYVLLSVVLPYRGDAFAFNTEWCVAFFTSLAAWAFARHVADGRQRWLAAAGAALGTAFLSKQPALLDAAAPVLGLAYLAWRRPAERRPLPYRVAALVGGWLLPVALVAAYFAARGALRDAVYYAWTYNVQVYGPEITTGERLASGLKLVEMYLHQASCLLPWTALALGVAAFRVAQRRPAEEEAPVNEFLAVVLAWAITSVGGAMSGGRGFDHYFIQALPPLCLLTGWLLARIVRLAVRADCRIAVRAAAAFLLAITLGSLATAAWAQRQRTLPPDSSVRAAQAVRAATLPGERIFVWGYHPEFFLFADRPTASRFVYSSFLTGLVPWSNTAPETDTTYAIVPGAMETLLAELEEHRPVFFIDCSAGPNRFWQKYPLEKFPALRAFVSRHYVLMDPEQFRGQGYDLYLLRDESRRTPSKPPVSRAAALAVPRWFGQSRVPNQPGYLTIKGSCASGQLTRLELLVGGRSWAAVSFAPVSQMQLRIPVAFQELGLGRHAVELRATAADGTTRTSAPAEIEVTSTFLPESALAPFSLPQVSAPIRPLFVQTLYGASAELQAGRQVFYAHAPSTLAFPLPATAREIVGGFGFREGAWDPARPAPTDGAEFRVELVTEDGRRQLLFLRLLQPTTVEADRSIQPLQVTLPANRAPGTHIEFVITPGPHDNPATDWTFWTDLRLESSR